MTGAISMNCKPPRYPHRPKSLQASVLAVALVASFAAAPAYADWVCDLDGVEGIDGPNANGDGAFACGDNAWADGEGATALGAHAFATAMTQGSGVAAGSVGFRPESIRIEGRGETAAGENLTVDGTVFAVLATGGSWTVEVVADGRHFFATTSVTPTCRTGDDIRMRVAGNDVHVFDTEGDRVGTH
jgi:hypothetical protein